jgi:hypothetical protein
MAYNPKSLENLGPKITKLNAADMQKKSVASRMANKEARERLKLTAAELKVDVDELTQEVSAIGVLKLSMLKAVQAEDYEEASRLAAILAEFEQPKLARVDQTNTEITADELSDEELDAKLRELGLKE